MSKTIVYKKLKGVFKQRVMRDSFTKALGDGKVGWVGSLTEGTYVYEDRQIKDHFDRYHKDLALPIEFIT